jgi:hypothetical protein
MNSEWVFYGENFPMTDTSSEIQEMVRSQLMSRSGSERFVMGRECSRLPAGWFWLRSRRICLIKS